MFKGITRLGAKIGGFRDYKGSLVPKFVQGMFIKLRKK